MQDLTTKQANTEVLQQPCLPIEKAEEVLLVQAKGHEEAMNGLIKAGYIKTCTEGAKLYASSHYLQQLCHH